MKRINKLSYVTNDLEGRRSNEAAEGRNGSRRSCRSGKQEGQRVERRAEQLAGGSPQRRCVPRGQLQERRLTDIARLQKPQQRAEQKRKVLIETSSKKRLIRKALFYVGTEVAP